MRTLTCSFIFCWALLAAAEPAVRLRNDATYTAHVAQVESERPAVHAAPHVLAEWHWRMASALMDCRRYAEAEAHAREVVALAPGFAPALSNLSVMLGKQGRHADALAAVDRALLLDPTSLHARLVRPSWLLGLGRRDEALAAFADVPRPAGGDDLRLYHGAEACFFADVGDAARVEAGMRAALADDPEGSSRDFFARDLVFDRYRAEPWFVDLVGVTLDQPY